MAGTEIIYWWSLRIGNDEINNVDNQYLKIIIEDLFSLLRYTKTNFIYTLPLIEVLNSNFNI